MKLTINKLELLEALNVTGKAISPNAILPILSSYLFAINDDKIRITGGGSDLTIHYNLEIAACGFKTEIAIPKSKLLDLISDSPNQPIVFEIAETEINGKLEPSSVKITTNIGKYVIPVVYGEDYPCLSIEDPINFSVPKESLINGIEATLFACSNDELRPAITGVNFVFEGATMECASTNTHVLSTKTTPLDEPIAERRNMILPKRILNVLVGMPAEKNIGVMVTKKNIRFIMSPAVTVESVLIDEKYVDYRSVIPTQMPGNFTLRKATLLSSVKRVNRFSDLGTSQLVIVVSENNCNISTSNDFGENADENLEIDFKGDGVTIGMSGKFLIESLNRIKGNDVNISFGRPNQPFLVREVDDNMDIDGFQNLILIMPMMLNN
jgi:DNA polymerase-3 subunit beta